MRAPVLLLALCPAAAVAELPRAADAGRCGPAIDRAAAKPEKPARPRPLNEMPDARPVLTVQREVGGCPVLLVREGPRIVEEPVGRPERRRVFRP